MQVRSVEFQENFRLVTLEASRQQSVLNREGDDITQQAASSVAEQRTVDLERPNPATESDAPRPVEEEGQQQAGSRREGGADNEANDEQQSADQRGLPQGRSIDILA